MIMLITVVSSCAHICLTNSPLDGRGNDLVRLVADAEARRFLAMTSCPDAFNVLEIWTKRSPSYKLHLAKTLAKSLQNNAVVKLRSTADLIIPNRIVTGGLMAYSHGYCPGQDVFLVGGRAAWGIAELTNLDQLPTLDDTLTAGEWNKRALAIEVKVKAFVEKSDKPKKK